MRRFTIALVAATVVCGTALGADRPVVRHGWPYAARQLPAGLPHPHYDFRTTISYGPPYPYRRRVHVYEPPVVVVTPVYVPVPYIPVLIGAPSFPYEYDDWDSGCGIYDYC